MSASLDRFLSKNTRDEKARQLQGIVTRFRSIARGHYGPDSAQYKQAGGTPLSARRSSARKAKPSSANQLPPA